MEKSIEDIWKEGFLKKEALVAPKINNLYSQKSIHIIDKFKKMYKINLIAIIVFSFIFLILSFFMGIPIMGIIFFVTLSVLVYINKPLLKDLKNIEKGENSYQYLKAFNQWLQKLFAINKRISTFLYPIIFMSFLLGFWFKDAKGMFLGDRILNNIYVEFPNTIIIFGLPLIGVFMIVLILGLLSFFGARIYQWDFNIVYGRILKKLEELMSDIESLNE
ncbi:hypothetical protein [Wenyingzhuangia marina]|uniref:Sensor n=1 Tax=Wenyingzhuangia marina TaxID=1195760 RepID=A0A1M5V6M4_9FLAO|nr:hypothetical protein [Wenyingzhuangia marina]GGF74013.1 hypothetical protein GCM10011397_16200 [Wenyingzhuangia marina]SHH70932.1 hypothetical protein SAMN05444281_1558 [Wenyingzhuangia marina]